MPTLRPLKQSLVQGCESQNSGLGYVAQRLRGPGFDSDSWCLTGAHKTPASEDMMAPTSIALTCVTPVPVYKHITENKNAINVKSHSLRQKVECSGAGGMD